MRSPIDMAFVLLILQIAMVRYPNPMALLQMAQSAEYQALSGNRSSGLEGQMNIAVFQN